MDEAELGTLDLGDPENVLLDDFVLGADMLGDFIANGDEGNDDLFGEGGEEDWDTDGGEGYSDDGQDLPDMFGERFFRSVRGIPLFCDVRASRRKLHPVRPLIVPVFLNA